MNERVFPEPGELTRFPVTESQRMSATMNLPARTALYLGWHVFWQAAWQYVRHPRSPEPLIVDFWDGPAE